MYKSALLIHLKSGIKTGSINFTNRRQYNTLGINALYILQPAYLHSAARSYANSSDPLIMRLTVIIAIEVVVASVSCNEWSMLLINGTFAISPHQASRTLYDHYCIG